jgi:nucleoid DNA-binding protein
MANTMSKSELIQRILDGHPNEIARKDVKGVIDAVAAIGHKELKKTGAFVVPGLAKFIVIKKPATKARDGGLQAPASQPGLLHVGSWSPRDRRCHVGHSRRFRRGQTAPTRYSVKGRPPE